MPRDGGGLAFVALDEAQLAADRERGHVFTDRLLHARGREETMLLGAATLEPMVRALLPEAEIEQPAALLDADPCRRDASSSRLPPRSRSSRSRSSRSTRWPRCCAASAAARRW